MIKSKKSKEKIPNTDEILECIWNKVENNEADESDLEFLDSIIKGLEETRKDIKKQLYKK